MKVLGVETRQSWGTPDNENVILNIELLKQVKIILGVYEFNKRPRT